MKKIVSILLILTIVSSLFLLTACDDSTTDNTNIIPGKANYVEYTPGPTHGTTSYIDAILVNAEKITDNYFVIHVLDHNFRTDMVLVNKNQVNWYYYPDDFFVEVFHRTYDEIIKDEQKYSLDEMKNMICEDEDVTVYDEDGFLAIEYESGKVRYLDRQDVYYKYSDN